MALNGTQSVPTRELENLADYIALWWRFKGIILGATILVGAVAFTQSALTPRAFRSTVTFAATQPKFGTTSPTLSSAAAFRPMVESLTTAAAVIGGLGLDQPPYSLTPSTFLDRVISVSEVRGTNLITVEVTVAEPGLAANIANQVAAHAVQAARRVSASEVSHARDLIKEELDLAKEQLDRSDVDFRAYRQQVRIEALRKDVEARLGGSQSPVFAPRAQPQLPSQSDATQVLVSVAVAGPSTGRDGLLEVAVKIASQKARIAAAERDLAGRARGDGLYENQEASLVAMRSELASLEQQKAALTSGYQLDAGTLKVLDHLYEVETDLARRQLERDVAERAYTDLSLRYQDARLQVIGRSAEFVVIDPAVPADRPVSRHVARNTAVAMAIMLLLVLSVLVLWDSVQRRRASLS